MSRRTRKSGARQRWLSAALALLFFAGLAGGLLAGYRYLADPTHFPVRTIRVENRFRHLDRGRLQRALSAAVEGSFFSVDLEKVRAAAVALPWVAEARVRRAWPDRLEVEIVEQQPLAHWNRRGLVNSRGEVFHPAETGRLRLDLQFRGPEEKAPQMVEFYREILPGFRDHGLEIAELSLDRRGEWRLRLKQGLTLVVGREQRRFRIRRLLEVYAVLQQEKRAMRRIDLRYEQGFAVAWQQENKS